MMNLYVISVEYCDSVTGFPSFLFPDFDFIACEWKISSLTKQNVCLDSPQPIRIFAKNSWVANNNE